VEIPVEAVEAEAVPAETLANPVERRNERMYSKLQERPD
jgi:hypothetical protein